MVCSRVFKIRRYTILYFFEESWWDEEMKMSGLMHVVRLEMSLHTKPNYALKVALNASKHLRISRLAPRGFIPLFPISVE